jgi:hypothetical protein
MDDHDYGVNDNFGDYMYSKLYIDAVHEYWYQDKEIEKPTLNSYGSDNIGHFYEKIEIFNNLNIQFLILDPHNFSTNNNGNYANEEATYFGEMQWNWLETKLSQSADLRVLVLGPCMFFTGNQYSNKNSITAFPFEQQRFANLIRKTKANGIVVMTGDSHAGMLFKSGTDFPYSIYNIHTPSVDHTRNGAPSSGDRLAVENYPPVVGNATQSTGLSCIDVVDAPEPYIKIGHRRMFGMNSGGLEPEKNLKARLLSPEPEVLVYLKDLKVVEDVPENFNWKTDYTTFPLTSTPKVTVAEFEENVEIGGPPDEELIVFQPGGSGL